MNGDWSAALWALALLATLGALWIRRELLVALTCAVALAVLLLPALRGIDKLLRLGKVITIVLLGLAGALASVFVVHANAAVHAAIGIDGPRA